MDGVTLYELGDIMATLGAEVAYNLDGGGSTSMVLQNNGQYQYLNSPSDPGGPRSLSNAILFVKGQNQTSPPPHDVPDLSVALPMPSEININEESVLQWNHVTNRSGYRVKINDQTFNTASRTMTLVQLHPGLYTIQVKTLGDGPFYKDSDYSDALSYIVYPESIQPIYNLFKQFGRKHILE